MNSEQEYQWRERATWMVLAPALLFALLGVVAAGLLVAAPMSSLSALLCGLLGAWAWLAVAIPQLRFWAVQEGLSDDDRRVLWETIGGGKVPAWCASLQLPMRPERFYALLAVAVFVAFVATESVVSELLEGWFGWPRYVGATASGLLVSMLMWPVFRWTSKALANSAARSRQSKVAVLVSRGESLSALKRNLITLVIFGGLFALAIFTGVLIGRGSAS